MLCSRNISVHLSEIQGSCACDFTEHGDKVAGVGKSGSAGNILDLHIRSGKQKLTGAADAVGADIAAAGPVDALVGASGAAACVQVGV